MRGSSIVAGSRGGHCIVICVHDTPGGPSCTPCSLPVLYRPAAQPDANQLFATPHVVTGVTRLLQQKHTRAGAAVAARFG